MVNDSLSYAASVMDVKGIAKEILEQFGDIIKPHQENEIKPIKAEKIKKEKSKKAETKEKPKKVKTEKSNKEKVNKEKMNKKLDKIKKEKKEKKHKKINPIRQTSAFVQEKKRREEEKQRMIRVKQAETELIQLMGHRDFLKSKLNELNPGKKKESQAIVQINLQLRDIEDRINAIEIETGVHIDSLQSGSKVMRFFGKMKNKISNGVKKVKKFFTDHSDGIIAASVMIIPTCIAAVVKTILKV